MSDIKKRNFCSPFWRPEIWNQGVGSATVFPGSGEDPSRLFQLLVFPGVP